MKHKFFILHFTFCILYSAFTPVSAGIVSGNALKINSCAVGAKSLSTPNSSLEESVDVIGWAETNVPAQRWIASNAGENLFYLTNAYSGIQLVNSSRRPKASDRLIQKSNESDYGKWEFVPVANPAFPNAYFIRLSYQTSGDLYIELDSNADGSLVKLQTKRTDADSLRQMWTVTAEDILPNRVTPAFRDSVMRGWKNRYFNQLKTSTGFWGEAEMMETILDAYETTGKQEYKTMFEEVYEHFVSTPAGWGQPGNGQDWRWNEYNDDIAWAVLASVRAYLMFEKHPNSNINYLTIAKNNYSWMYNRALLPGGTLRWKETPAGNRGSNSCINGPAEVAACYLGIATSDESYFEKAKNLYAKQRQILYEPATGKVFDSGSWNSEGTSFTVGNSWVSTYNQGTFLGAALMLYNHYGTEQYKNDAHKIVEWTQKDLCNARGVVRVCGSGDDLQGFKGILMRYLRRYVVDLALPEKVEWLQRNALHAYNNRNSKGISWTAWWEKSAENFVFSDGYNFSNTPFGSSTAVSAAFNAPLSAGLIIKNAFETIEAENFDYVKGIFVERTDDTTAVIGNTADNYYTAYSNVDFGTGQATGIAFHALGGNRSTSKIEVRLDSLSGTLLATVEVPPASGGNWVTVASPVVSVGSRHNIYLVYKNSGFKIDHFRFTKEGTGIENVSVSPQFELYPNPATGRLFVKFPLNGQLTVYDVSGKQVLSSGILAGTTELNISDCISGIYFACIDTTAGRFTGKFLKE